MMSKSIAVAYIDFLSALVAVFSALMVLAMAQKVVEDSKGNVDNKAEFIAELEWTDGSRDDIDLLVQNPYEDIVFFRKQDVGMMTLDRDDRGNNNTTFAADGTRIENTTRKEVVSIRGIMPGKHTVNVLFYEKRMKEPEAKAKVNIIKLNPYKEVVSREIILKKSGDQITIATFVVDEKGGIISVDTETQKNFVVPTDSGRENGNDP